MFKNFTMALAIAGLATTGLSVMPTSATAQSAHKYQDYRGDHRHRTYRGYSNRNRHCGSGNGAVGTVAGGAGGAVLGNVLGGGTLGTVAGGVGGALLGRHFDKQHTKNRNRDRNGC